MEKEKYLQMYDNLKNKSIGNNKRVKKNKKTVKAILKISIATMLSTMALASFVGCTSISREYNPEDYKIVIDTYSGYKPSEIINYEKLRVNDIMQAYGMEDYSIDGIRKNYHYSSSDYEKIIELDETYIHGFYMYSDMNTVTEVCKSLGYDNLTDYLIKNNYVDENGMPSEAKWEEENLEKIGSIMDGKREKSK